MGAVFGKVNEETPAHDIIHATEHYQIWRYTSSVAATVHASSLATSDQPAPTGRDFESAAFRTLAKYIGVFTTPQNKAAANDQPQSESIAMTAPVVLSPPKPEGIAMTAPVVLGGDAEEESMTFLLPSKYKTVEEAPVPENPAVKLSMAPAGRCDAVFRYSGNLNMQDAPEKAKGLIEALEKDAVKIVGHWTVHGYNPPFTLPWCKRNEIHIPIDPDSIQQKNPPTQNE